MSFTLATSSADDTLDHNKCIDRVISELEAFYELHPHIAESSHGLSHALAVHGHAVKAIECVSPPLSSSESMEIRIAALLHDVDDGKYFPKDLTDIDKDRYGKAHAYDGGGGDVDSYHDLPNAMMICANARVISNGSVDRIASMIRWVSCSKNGNTVPIEVGSTGSYHLLIPRWSDRLEAVGAIGVVRCYRYNRERGQPLWGDASPRAVSAEDVFRLASSDRFESYQTSGGRSDDMISHYYDKLLHIARPPPSIVRNSYLEEAANESASELMEVCVRFGRTGVVDEEYILELEKSLRGRQ